MATAAFSDTTETDWPEPVYFPQNQTDKTDATQGKALPEQVNLPNAEQKTAKPKKGLWPFKHHGGKQDSAKPLTDEQITKVGPKDPPPSPYPLFRLPMPILTETGPLPPGIYLVKPATQKPASSSTASTQDISLVLTRQGQVLFSFKAHPSAQPDDNMALTGTPSPITRTVPPAVAVTKVEAQVSEDLKTLTIVITENEQRFESDPFPVNTDTRHILTF